MQIDSGMNAPRRRRVTMVIVAATLVLVAAGLAAVFTHGRPRQGSAPPPAPSRATSAPVRIAAPHDAPDEVPPIAGSADPESFAVMVAEGLFEWDTTTVASPAAYTNRLVAVADPTGEESGGLVADVANYLPAPRAWASLRGYRTRQWLEVDSARVPRLWPVAVAEAGPGGLLPGTVAYTVEGVRHRAGVWEGSLVTSSHAVSFTVFIVCAPSYPTCHLLRLSLPDTPLR